MIEELEEKSAQKAKVEKKNKDQLDNLFVTMESELQTGLKGAAKKSMPHHHHHGHHHHHSGHHNNNMHADPYDVDEHEKNSTKSAAQKKVVKAAQKEATKVEPKQNSKTEAKSKAPSKTSLLQINQGQGQR